MKRMRNKWAGLAIITAMLFSLLPPFAAFAAGTITITNLYTDTVNAGTSSVAPKDDSLVQRVTQSTMNINADISGFSADEIQNIFYEITNVNTGVSTSNNVNKPVQNASNNNEITFNNVQLSEGLNKITIKYGSSTTITSSPGWVYFTPVSNISNLQINKVTFADNGIYPTNGQYTNVLIEGSSPNATEVSATVGGTTYTATSLTNGNFTFIANSGRASDITFTPGDNLITFVAKNLTNSYTLKKPFVYDNGKAFAYNATVQEKNPTSTSTQQNLYAVPTVNKSDNDNVSVKTLIKNPVTTAPNPDYVSMDVTVLGVPGFKISYNFSSGATSITGGLNANGTTVPAGASTNTSVSLNSSKSTSAYNVYDFASDLPVNSSNPYQQVVFTFTTNGGVTTQTTYTYYFFDPNIAYTDHVAQQFKSTNGTSSYETDFSESGQTGINQFPATLKIYTNKNTKHIQVKLGGATGTDYVDTSTPTDYDSTVKWYKVTPAVDAGGAPIKDAQGNQLNVTTVNLQGIADGPNILTVIPYDSGATGPSDPYAAAGVKNYNINVASSPYVILTNLYNGKVVPNKLKITCLPATLNGNEPCIQGRFVNLPYSEYQNVKMFVNDNPVTLNVEASGDDPTDFGKTGEIRSDGTFYVKKDVLKDYFDSDGKKAIKFNLYLNGQMVTSTTVTIYVLSDSGPLISTMEPKATSKEPNATFTAGTSDDSYSTNASIEFQLNGTISNVEITDATKYTLTVTTPNSGPTSSKTVPLTITPVGGKINDDPLDGNKFTYNFQLSTPYQIPSGVYGNFVFILTGTNSTGLTASKTITITRQPVSYTFIQPDAKYLIKNSNNQDQYNMNANFQTIIIQADQADSVTFGKTEATPLGGNKFQYEATNLKAGQNTITFTVTRGSAKTTGTLVLNNQNLAVEGAQNKTTLATKMSEFNGKLQLSFPNGTKLMRNDRNQTVDNQFITSDRKLLFGIASLVDGRVDKSVESSSTPGLALLTETTGRFRPASPRYWIDAGVIPATALNNPSLLQTSLTGSGNLPYPTASRVFLFPRASRIWSFRLKREL
ncbi:hypothetical protein LJK87_36890 [Paenibacillus sp. P25]|nr:hypothetical protein LJK87_36890 [Paenibacillus sp. P25]